MTGVRTIGARVLPVLAVIGLLAGCAGGQRVEQPGQRAAQRVEPPGQGPAQRVALSAQQVEAVRSGVKQMIDNPDTARFARVTALSFAGDPGVHVCGHVTYKDATDQTGAAKPYYIELREVDGKPAAERGQVGATQRALAQVEFMCRRHRTGSGPDPL